MRLETILAPSVFSLSGCVEYGYTRQKEEPVAPSVETGDTWIDLDTGVDDSGLCVNVDYFIQDAKHAAVDVMWMLDKSGSMDENKPYVLEGIGGMFGAIPADFDARVGVMSMDITEALVADVPYLTKENSVADAEALYDSLWGMDSIERGLESFQIVATKNDSAMSWLREEGDDEGNPVPMLVIEVSDEDDLSYLGQVSSSEEAATRFEDWYSKYRGERKYVFFAAIVQTSLESTCDTFTIIGERYIQVADYYEGVLLNICSPGEEWAAAMADAMGQIGQMGTRDSITLSYQPLVPTVHVKKNGYYFSENGNWYYDENQNTVFFLNIPTPGDRMEAFYNVDLYAYEGDCPVL